MNLSQKSSISLFVAAILMSATPAMADDVSARKEAARMATGKFVKQLGGELKKEMKANGPASAITVCRDLAPQIAGEISRENGWQVTRVGTRVRNPMLGLPDSWESKVLDDFAARAAKGEDYKDMAHSEVVAVGDEKYYRFMKAIPVKPACLSCHGSDKQIPGAVQAKLDKDYPHDRATGYKPGELRGAVSIMQPLSIPLVTTN